MKYVKIIFQLNSIKLILLSAVAFVFLAMSDADSSNKPETTQTDVTIANEQGNSLAFVGSGN